MKKNADWYVEKKLIPPKSFLTGVNHKYRFISGPTKMK